MSVLTSSLRILPFQSDQHGEIFDCGEHTVNKFFMDISRMGDAHNTSRAFTAVDDVNTILGFYCISASSIEFTEQPKQENFQSFSYPISAARIDQLAVNKTVQRKKIGARLLVDALQRIYEASHDMKIDIVLVDAYDDKVRAFYLHFGFLPLSGEPSKLFLPLNRIEQLFKDITVQD